MIYISTSCVQNIKIADSVKELADNGFRYIELSGGTKYYANFELDLLELKDKYGLHYRCHNYFPPPEKPFVLNLASLDQDTFSTSFSHLDRAISLSDRLGADKFSFHAGFFIDISVSEIGRKLSKSALFDRDESIDRFCRAYELLKKKAGKLDLCIENNVFSKENSVVYSKKNPLMLTCFSEYEALRKMIDFNLLLDIAHLKVSANTLGISWQQELESMMNVSSYIHVSDNDGLADSNKQLDKHSDIVSALKQSDTKGKDFTLEVYEDLDCIKRSYEVLSEAIS